MWRWRPCRCTGQSQSRPSDPQQEACWSNMSRGSCFYSKKTKVLEPFKKTFHLLKPSKCSRMCLRLWKLRTSRPVDVKHRTLSCNGGPPDARGLKNEAFRWKQAETKMEFLRWKRQSVVMFTDRPPPVWWRWGSRCTAELCTEEHTLQTFYIFTFLKVLGGLCHRHKLFIFTVLQTKFWENNLALIKTLIIKKTCFKLKNLISFWNPKKLWISLVFFLFWNYVHL